MAYFGITASSEGLTAAVPAGDLAATLAERLRALPARAPVVVLVHGYKFSPLMRLIPLSLALPQATEGDGGA